MRSWFRRVVTLALALLICVPALATDALAWEKEQQALNDVMEQDDTLFAPIDVNLPAIAKMVEGENAPNERFTFILKGKSGAPMPEGAAGSRYRVSRVGKGLVSLGSITFEQSGIYVYTIYEMASDDPNWTYDDSEYTLTIKVKKDGEVLTAETALTKDGKSAKKNRIYQYIQKNRPHRESNDQWSENLEPRDKPGGKPAGPHHRNDICRRNTEPAEGSH